MNDIVLNGETLEISEVVDSIVISGFDHTFDQNKVEGNLIYGGGSSPGPEPGGNKITIKTTFDISLTSNNTITIQTGVS